MADDDSGVCRCRLFIDILLVVMLLIPINICEFFIQPQRRGFFCNDETLQYPYQPATISGGVLVVIIAIIPLLLIVIVEFACFYHAVKCGKNLQPLLKWRLSSLLLQCSKQFGYFIIGLILTFDTAEVAKFTIGRLRPHFMAVCQPRMPGDRNCSDLELHGRYIDNYECVANGFTALDVRQLRLSFPSHHSALCFYAMLYLTLYLQKRFNWSGSIIARSFLQFVLLMSAWYVSLSRIVDYWHHWSDVMAGTLMGVVVAVLNALCIAKLIKVSNLNNAKRIQQQEQEQLEQSAACLQREGSVTPLPYTK